MTAPRVSWIAILLGGLAIAGSAILAFVGMGRMGMLILLGGLGIAGCVLLGRAAYRSGAQGPATDLNEDVEVRRARGGEVMRKATRVFWMLVWLGGLAIAGSVILTITASRVGEHKASTFGQAYVRFQKSWGGEIGIVPPAFTLERSYTVRVYNNASERYELEQRTEQIPLVPRSIVIDSTVDYGEQKRGLLTFNAFEARNTETYVVPNKTDYTGELLAHLAKPDNANLVYDYRITVPKKENIALRPLMGESMVVLPELRPGEEIEIVFAYATKGMDIYKYNLSAYQNKVVESLKARIALNTGDFEIYRFGLPHETEITPAGTNIRFEINDFSTTQDLGITFDSKQMYLDQIQSLISYSPVSLLLYLGAIFIFTQIRAARFNVFHYLFIAAINVFYFLFVAYLIRFFGVGITFAMSIALTAAMFLVYCPNVLGWRFAGRVAGPYLFVSTVVFSSVFLMPIFRGILFVTLVFLIFMSIMIAVSRSDISKWPILRGDDRAMEGG